MKPSTVVLLLGVGCSPAAAGPLVLPSPQSESPVPRQGGLWAGFAKTDITPPPGMGLSGNGFEGKQAKGYRQRIYARAMVLEDDRGERMAFVAAGVPHMSAVVHRLVAERTLRAGTGIGADRLVLVATHTHSSVSNYYDNASYNGQSGPLSGFDVLWIEFLVDRIAGTVEAAVQDMAPSRAAWSLAQTTEVAVNRARAAFDANPVTFGQDTDDTTYMFRVDHCETETACRPRGVFSVFGIHPTGYPPSGDLVDPDIPGFAHRAVERAIDRASGVPDADTRFRSRAVHVFFNGTEGDITPNRNLETRCEQLLAQRPGDRPRGSRWSPVPGEVWEASDRRMTDCTALARDSVRAIGERLSSQMVAQWQAMNAMRRQWRIDRAFATVHVPTRPVSPPICPDAREGTASIGGAPTDGPTRLLGWAILGVIKTGFEPGPESVANPPHGCHGEKKVTLGFFGQGLAVGQHGMPEYAQISVTRIGETIIVAVPWEVTTVAGRLIKNAVRSAMPEIRYVAVSGLANGYFHYLTTAEEYGKQLYEGGSNIYGRNTIYLVIQIVEDLTRQLGDPRMPVDEIVAHPGGYQTHFRRLTTPQPMTRSIRSITCNDRVLTMEWEDLPPGQFAPSEGQVLEIRHNGMVVAWDDRPDVEVRALGPADRTPTRWQVVYRSPIDLANHSVHLLARGSLPALSAACP